MTSRPVEHLRTASRLYPQAWRQVEKLRAGRGQDLPKWPAWCFLPMAGWYAIVSGGGDNRVAPHLGMDIGRLAAVGTWRYSQGIYRIDADVFAALWDTPISGDMPAEVLLRLPEWSLYIETPGQSLGGMPLYGFFAHLEWDAKDLRHELRLLLDAERALLPVPLHLGDWPLARAVERALMEATRYIPAGMLVEFPEQAGIEDYSRLLAPLVSLVLYMCSDEPDFGPAKRPERPRPKRTKQGWRLFPPPGPTIWHIGERTGKQIRESAEATRHDTTRHVRAHLRRAHWHGYWTGPRDGARRFKYNWLSPILVAAQNEAGTNLK